MHTLIVLLGFLLIIFGFGATKSSLENLKNLLIIGTFVFLILSPWMLRNYITVGSFSIDPGRFDLLFKDRWQSRQPTNSSTIPLFKNQQEYQYPITKTASLNFGLPEEKNELTSFVEEFISHFLHNEVLSVLALPSSYQVMDPQDYYDF